MIEIAIMLEGQDGLNWPRFQKLAGLVEEAGFVGLYRSDHYTNPAPPDKDSLELWVSLTWLAGNTTRLEFGPMVSPLSFRHPTMTARMATAVDDLSGGRLTLGLGAGWQEREHTNYGWDLLEIPERFARFEEGLEVISRLLNSPEPVNFEGKYFHLKEAVCLPHPQRPGGPPILIGGNGPLRTLPLAARFAREWNAVFIGPEKISKLNILLNEILEKQGRKPEEIKRSLMTRVIFAKDQAELNSKVNALGGDINKLKERGLVVGTGPEIEEQLGRLVEAGVKRVMLQWIEVDDLAGLEGFARAVLKS